MELSNSSYGKNVGEPLIKGTKLEYFKKSIDDHFNKENLIMKEMLEADLSKEEWVELQDYIKNHSHSRFVYSIRKETRFLVDEKSSFLKTI